MTGDRFIRLMLVLSGLSPVFLLWAIRGVQDVPSNLWGGLCLLAFVIPNAVVKRFFWKSKRNRSLKVLTPHRVEIHQEQLLTYLLAMLLPLIEVSFNGIRDALAGSLAFIFTVFLFYKMGLHYINLFFLILGYRIFEVSIECGAAPLSQEGSFVVISRSESPRVGVAFTGYRLGGNFLVEATCDDRREIQPQ